MVANRTRGARGGLKLNCTLGESPTHWRLRQQPQRKMFLAFRICARLIFSEKGKGVFLGVLPSKYSGSAWGFNTDSAKRKSVFLGKRFFRFASADFPPAGGVWGGMRAGFVSVPFAKNSAAKFISIYMMYCSITLSDNITK